MIKKLKEKKCLKINIIQEYKKGQDYRKEKTNTKQKAVIVTI